MDLDLFSPKGKEKHVTTTSSPDAATTRSPSVSALTGWYPFSPTVSRCVSGWKEHSSSASSGTYDGVRFHNEKRESVD